MAAFLSLDYQKKKPRRGKEVRCAYSLRVILTALRGILALSAVGCVNESTTSTQLIKDVTAPEALTLIPENQEKVDSFAIYKLAGKMAEG